MSKKPIALTLHGKAFDAVSFSGSAIAVTRWLDSQGEGELFESSDIIKATGVIHRTLINNARVLRDEGYAAKVGRLNVYGNRAAIAELKRRLTN